MTTVERKMEQTAPYPVELEEIVKNMKYRHGWQFTLEDIDSKDGCRGLTFIVQTRGYNAYHIERGDGYRVRHFFPVPRATYNRQSWLRWVLDQLVKVEVHEACEFFRLAVAGLDNEGETTPHLFYHRPFAPNHGPGWDPYGVRELNTVEAAETTFRGVRQEGTQR